MAIHKHRKHVRLRRHCKECDYKENKGSTMALANSEALVERFHGEFKYKCVKCDLTRNSNSHMKNHMHRKHVRLKYLCHQCAFTVRLNQILIKHFKSQLVQVWKTCCCLNCVSSSQHEGFNETGNIRGDLQVKITFLYRNGIPSP